MGQLRFYKYLNSYKLGLYLLRYDFAKHLNKAKPNEF